MADLNKISDIPYSATGDRLQDEKLLEPYKHLVQAPEEEICEKLFTAFNIWLKIPDEKLYIIKNILRCFYNANVLLDDIEDNSVLRRRVPTAHSIYGVANTINAANYVYFIALEKVFSLGHPDAVQIIIEELLKLHRGQGIEIYWRDNFICPTEEEYKQMATNKTGALITLLVKLMQFFSDNKSDFNKLAKIIGLYYQLCNDYCNLYKQNYAQPKIYAEDITDGKFTLPIIHAIRSQAKESKGREIICILQQRTKDIELKKYCISLLEKYGSFKYTYDIITRLDEQAREEIQKLGENPYMDKVLDELHSLKLT